MKTGMISRCILTGRKITKLTTYRSNVHLVESLEPKDLIKEQIFDTDILVLGHSDVDINYSLALAAKEYGVDRVLTRIQNSRPN